MASKSLILAILVACLALAALVSAQDRAQLEPTTAPAKKIERPSFTEMPLEKLPPRQRVIRKILDERASKLKELQERYDAASSDAEALQIQREMHQLKQGTEIALLKAQLEFAQTEGQSEKVTKLEKILEQIDTREGVLGPAERSQSRAGNGGQ